MDVYAVGAQLAGYICECKIRLFNIHFYNIILKDEGLFTYVIMYHRGDRDPAS